ncbi:hypothetical protein CYMTET_38387 [Cymbomonas tetramitiformis]|uniref:Guanylate cyclase domain-containing protein n=1 Tax=Cymbomonas tetramitiformis TaxID=36881 RepID=A0AAE0CE86_9CHLO|nr:hypothetical protein CYMTET_38387 [Cymbomonas tetramitiformis]
MVEKLGLMKVETIGDSYWVSSSTLHSSSPRDASDLVKMALYMQQISRQLFMLGNDKPSCRQRIGLHCGPATGGIVGWKMPRYHLFGPHVAFASLFEQLGSIEYILTSASFANLLEMNSDSLDNVDIAHHDPRCHVGMLPCERIKWLAIEQKLHDAANSRNVDPRSPSAPLTPVATISEVCRLRIDVVLHCLQPDSVALQLSIAETLFSQPILDSLTHSDVILNM